MCKLHLTEPSTIIKDGKEVTLTLPLYNVSDEKLMIDNGFFKCWKCKDFFDHANEFNLGEFHPQNNLNNRDYCDTCFSKVETTVQPS